jgi:hypothetical protein
MPVNTSKRNSQQIIHPSKSPKTKKNEILVNSKSKSNSNRSTSYNRSEDRSQQGEGCKGGEKPGPRKFDCLEAKKAITATLSEYPSLMWLQSVGFNERTLVVKILEHGMEPVVKAAKALQKAYENVWTFKYDKRVFVQFYAKLDRLKAEQVAQPVPAAPASLPVETVEAVDLKAVRARAMAVAPNLSWYKIEGKKQ